MEMAGQIHASVALFLCTKPPNVIEYEKEWAPELTVTLWGDTKPLSYRESNHDSLVIQSVNYGAFRDEFAVTLQITTAPLNLPLSDPIVTHIAAFYCANSEKIKVQVFLDMTLGRFLNICYSLAISTAAYPTLFTNQHGVITQKTLIFISSVLRTFNLAT